MEYLDEFNEELMKLLYTEDEVEAMRPLKPVPNKPPMPVIKHRLKPRLRGRRQNNMLYTYRLMLGISQISLAQQVGITRRALRAIENNKSAPSVYTALAIAEVLDMKVEHIFKLPPLRLK